MRWAALLVLVFAMTDLASIADQSTVRLITIGRKSGEPRPVTIWFVAEGGVVFVQAGKDGATDWFRNLRKTPAVTLEIGDRRLRGEATVIDDPAETKRVHGLFHRKYWLARAASWVGMGIGAGRVVRIDVTGAPS